MIKNNILYGCGCGKPKPPVPTKPATIVKTIKK
jgi:hypothetical protein